MKRPNLRRDFFRNVGLGCGLSAILLAGMVRADPIAHWDFDKTDSDGTYRDSVNNGHPARPADRAEVQVYSGADPARFGNAVAFLGPSHPQSYLTIPPLTNIQTTSFTVATWVNLASQNTAFVLADWPSMAQSAYAFGFHPFGRNNLTAQPAGNITSVETASVRPGSNRRSIIDQKLADRAVPLNEWHHVAWVWDRDKETLTFYCDATEWAVARRTPVNPNYSKSIDIAVNNLPVRIGSQELTFTGPNSNMTGALDELWIFDQALTPLQIRNLIKLNDIRGAVATAPASTGPVTAPANGTATTEPVPAVVPESAPIDTNVAPAPAPVPAASRTGRSVAGSVSDRRTSPARSAGIVMCLTIIVAAGCYLIWALVERAKLRAAGQLR
jgi:hypothetical protein